MTCTLPGSGSTQTVLSETDGKVLNPLHPFGSGEGVVACVLAMRSFLIGFQPLHGILAIK